jgi:hypothetical protein
MMNQPPARTTMSPGEGWADEQQGAMISRIEIK